MDVCFDGLSEMSINQRNIYKLNDMFSDYINSFNDTKMVTTSFYINTPQSKLSDTDRFIKILVYDKYIKESRYKKLDEEYKDWKRFETTVKVEFKFKGFNLEDYIHDLEVIAKKFFNTSSFSYEYLNLQSKLLTDRRMHKGIVSL